MRRSPPDGRRGRRWAALSLVALVVLAGAPIARTQEPEATCECDVSIDKPRTEAGADGHSVVVKAFVQAADGDSPPVRVRVTPPWPDGETDALVDAIAAGASESVEVTLQVPANRPAATREEFVVALVGITDQDPANDSAIARGDTPAGPTAAPDLAITRAGADKVGRRVRVAVTVANEGAEAAGSTVAVSPPDGWDTPSPNDVADVPAGDSEETTFAIDIPDGSTGRFTFEVELEPLRGERDTADNTKNATLTIGAPANGSHPDLAVTALKPHQAGPGELTLQVRVSNRGDRRAGATDAVVTRPAWAGDATASVPALDPGAEEKVEIAVPVPVAQRGRRASMVVRASPVRGEEDESNNAATFVPVLLAAAAIRGGGGGSGGDPGGDPGDGPGTGLIVALASLAILLLGLAAYKFWPRPDPDGPQHDHGGGSAGAWPARAVHTGFSTAQDPERALAPDVALAAGEPCWFWLELGPPVVAPAGGGQRVALDVALFALSGGVEVAPGAGRGRLVLGGDGEARVTGQPAGAPASQSRLFFAVQPRNSGALRCSILAGNVVVWSQLLHVPVALPGRQRSAEVDYAIAPALDGAHLAALPRHRLSLLLNSEREGTHSITFAGEGEFQGAASFNAVELERVLDGLRGALRMAAWGDEGEWSQGRRYLYEHADPRRTRADLVRLAVRGFRLHTSLLTHLSSASSPPRALRELMHAPGLVQIAIRESAALLLPAALIYDRPLDTTLENLDAYELCPAFLAACDAGRPLETTACMRGDCPAYGQLEVVCPSGFWGYRHELGMPLSASAGQDVRSEIGYGGAPDVVMAVATDPGFELREPHQRALRLLAPARWHLAETRADALALMTQARGHVVYFYCHGGASANVPFLHVGGRGERPITADWLSANDVHFDVPRPLVFLNGCRTTAVTPADALEFVGVWLRISEAAGVVGTDITVFEPLATVFAEAFLQRFLGGEPLGQAMRGARLELLVQGNPLGLAYVPFALASLRLVDERPPL